MNRNLTPPYTMVKFMFQIDAEYIYEVNGRLSVSGQSIERILT